MERTATILANAIIGLAAGVGAYYGNETGGPELIFAGGCLGVAIGYFIGWPIAEYFEPIFTWLIDDYAPWVIVPLFVLLIGVLFTLDSDEQQCSGTVAEGVELEETVDGVCGAPTKKNATHGDSPQPS